MQNPPTNLRDYSANHRMLLISGLAVILGGAGAVLAWALLGLISAVDERVLLPPLQLCGCESGVEHVWGGWRYSYRSLGGLLIGVIARYRLGEDSRAWYARGD